MAIQVIGDGLANYRYFILCLLLFGLMCVYARNGQWVADADFWEHSAVLRELSTHILNPKHPQLLLDAPHAFYSPYAVLLAAFSRVSTLDAMTTFSIRDLRIWDFFFSVSDSLCFRLYRGESQHSRVLYATFCALMVGSNPWFYSGFFHIGGLGGRLSYPSTFATSLSLICLGSARTALEQKSPARILAILAVLVTVLISHPVSFLFLAAGLFSFAVDTKAPALTQLLFVVSLLVGALLVAGMWPYFPFSTFVLNESDVYHADNRVMYRDVLSRTWPALIGVPVIFAKLRQNWRHPLVIMIAILSGIYVCGALSGKYVWPSHFIYRSPSPCRHRRCGVRLRAEIEHRTPRRSLTTIDRYGWGGRIRSFSLVEHA